MTRKFNQLSKEQRYKIEVLIGIGYNQTEIAKQLGVHRSTISRELNRNTSKRGLHANVYNAQRAEYKTRLRHFNKKKHVKFNDDLKREMLHLLADKRYSPELISAHWRNLGISGVSHETIYLFLWYCKHTNLNKNIQYKEAYKFLKHSNRRQKRGNNYNNRCLISNRVSIEHRPSIVNERKRLGDIEVDLIVGKNHGSALLVTLDRASLHTTITKVTSKNSTIMKSKIIQKLSQYQRINTITFDNDQAFSKHEEIAKTLKCKTYFTRPYTSQDKGSIENRNGIIRQFFPKKTDFNLIHHSTIKSVENKINNRPIRKFNYQSANDVLLQLKI